MLEDSEVATGHLGQLAGVTRRVVTVLLLASLSRSASLSVETSRNSRNDTGASVPTTCGPVELAMTELAPITQTTPSRSVLVMLSLIVTCIEPSSSESFGL